MSKTFKIILILSVVASVVFASMAVIGFMGKEREYMKRLFVEDKLAITLKDKKNLENELATAKSAKEQSEAKVVKIEEKFKEFSSQIDDMKQKSEYTAAELDAKKTELAKIKIDLDNERKEKLTISKKLESLQDDYDKAKRESLKLADEKIYLEKKIIDLQDKPSVNLDKIVVNSNEDTSASQAPTNQAMQGKVLVVNKEYSFIVTDLGQDKNIQKGVKFDVMDGAKFLGQAEIDKVYDTMSSATILPGAKINDMKKGNVIIESR
jgi:chromosome segregation ATPase